MLGPLLDLRLSTAALATAVITALLAAYLRPRLPDGQRRRARNAMIVASISLLLQFVSAVTELGDANAATTTLGLIAFLALAFALVSVGGIVLFDVTLERLGVRAPSLVRDLLLGVVFIVSVFGLLRDSGVHLVSLVTQTAVLTAVVGLALQDTIANLFSGLALQVDHTINVGDWIQVGDHAGRVTQIKWRSTSIVTKDGCSVMVPNSTLLKSAVMNFSKPTPTNRLGCSIALHYRHAPNDVRAALLEAVREVPGVLALPVPDVIVSTFGDHAINYSVRFWVEDFENDQVIAGQVRTRLWYAVRRAGLEIPFPTRTLHLHQTTRDDEARAHTVDLADRLDALRQVELFAPLDEAELGLLAAEARVERFGAEERVLRQGDPGDSLFVVREGRVRVVLQAGGTDRELAVLGAGDFFGEMSLMTGEPRRATVIAATDVVCYVIGHAAVERLLGAAPRLAEEISAILSLRLGRLAGERQGLGSESLGRDGGAVRDRLVSRIRRFFGLRGRGDEVTT